jgi:HAD superfamily hydrolase (TIGR01509 family)
MDDLADYEANLTYTAIEGVLTFLDTLKQNNIPTALVTSGDRWKVKEVTGQLGLTGVFAAAITVNDIRRGKPDPECYLLAAQALQKLPERCLVFEDSISGVKAATAAGTFCIGVQAPQFAGALYQAGAGYVAPDFNGVRLATGGGDSPTSIQLYLDAEHSLPLHID